MKRVKLVLKSSSCIMLFCVIGFFNFEAKEVKATFFSRIFNNVAKRVNRGAVSSANGGLRGVPTQQNEVIQNDNTQNSNNSSTVTSRLVGVQGGLARNVDTNLATSGSEMGATGGNGSRTSAVGSVSSLKSLRSFDDVELESGSKVKQNNGKGSSTILSKVNLNQILNRDSVGSMEKYRGFKVVRVNPDGSMVHRKIEAGKTTEIHTRSNGKILKRVSQYVENGKLVVDTKEYDSEGNYTSHTVYKNGILVSKNDVNPSGTQQKTNNSRGREGWNRVEQSSDGSKVYRKTHDGKVMSMHEDKYARITKIVAVHSKNGNLIVDTKEFDSDGNCTRRTVETNGVETYRFDFKQQTNDPAYLEVLD